MKKKRNAQSLFNEKEQTSQLQVLKRQRLMLQARIDKVLDTLNELNESLRKLNAEIDVLEKQISLF